MENDFKDFLNKKCIENLIIKNKNLTREHMKVLFEFVREPNGFEREEARAFIAIKLHVDDKKANDILFDLIYCKEPVIIIEHNNRYYIDTDSIGLDQQYVQKLRDHAKPYEDHGEPNITFYIANSYFPELFTSSFSDNTARFRVRFINPLEERRGSMLQVKNDTSLHELIRKRIDLIEKNSYP